MALFSAADASALGRRQTPDVENEIQLLPDNRVAIVPYFTGDDQAPPQDAAQLALIDAFYDAKVTPEQFLAQANVKDEASLAKTLSTLFRTGPSAVFSKRGELTYFDYTPSEYGVKHAINYYIPKSYKADGTAAALFILHGGGSSTNTYESSREVSQMYMQEFIDFAERNGVILIGPASSLGWAYNTRILMRDLLAVAQQELAIDPDRFYFWGHSMGAMGLTRETHWLASRGAAFLPNAGGMQDEFRIPEFLRTYFDTRVVHSQGLQDEFEDFVTRTKDVQQKIQDLEAALGEKSGYSVIWEDRDHNPDMSTVISLLEQDILKVRRDKYQPGIYPLLGRLDAKNNRLGPDVDTYLTRDYFWIEAPNLVQDLGRKEFDQGKGENFVALSAKAAGNVYDIRVADTRVSQLRVLVSSKMADLTKPISIRVNGVEKFNGMVAPDVAHTVQLARERKDRSFLFENYVDVSLH